MIIWEEEEIMAEKKEDQTDNSNMVDIEVITSSVHPSLALDSLG
jgi:hypothetical protein